MRIFTGLQKICARANHCCESKVQNNNKSLLILYLGSQYTNRGYVHQYSLLQSARYTEWRKVRTDAANQ